MCRQTPWGPCESSDQSGMRPETLWFPHDSRWSLLLLVRGPCFEWQASLQKLSFLMTLQITQRGGKNRQTMSKRFYSPGQKAGRICTFWVWHLNVSSEWNWGQRSRSKSEKWDVESEHNRSGPKRDRGLRETIPMAELSLTMLFDTIFLKMPLLVPITWWIS